MKKEEFIKKLYNIFSNLSHNPKSDPYRVVGREFGYFDLPKKKSLAELANFGAFYRGFRDKLFLEEFLFDDDIKNFFLGRGSFGRGVYSTQDYSVAKSYSGFGKSNEDNVLKFYIKNYRMANYEDLVRLSRQLYEIIKYKDDSKLKIKENNLDERTKTFVEFVEGLGKKEQDIALHLLWFNDTSVLAVILGFDIVDLTEPRSSPDFLILNRSKIHVQDSDYNRIFGQSKRFKPAYPSKLIESQQKGE